MNLKLTLTATRPDTSAEFWYNTSSPLVALANTQSIELCDALGMLHTTETSDNGLTFKKIFSNATELSWSEFMAAAFALPDIISDRNMYFINNNHSLSLTRIDVDTAIVIAEIPDLIAHTNVPT